MKVSSSGAPCPICGQPSPRRLTSKTVSKKTYTLVVCTQCNQHYCDPVPTPDEIVGFYQGNYHHELRQEGASERIFGPKFLQYRQWVVQFLNRGRHIDIGTATGLFPSLMKEVGFDAEGTEYNRASAEWGTAHYKIRIRVGGLEQIASEFDAFDLISMTDVLEHTQHPLQALQSARRSLRARGHMLITFPDIRSIESSYRRTLARLSGRNWLWSCCNIPLHVWEFTPATARAMFDKAGFEVLAFRRSQVTPDSYPGVASVLSLPLRALTLPFLACLMGTQMEFIIRKRSDFV